MKNIAVAGIGTDIGKTLVSAIFVEALSADYWKPVQAGNLEDSDTDCVRSLVSNTVSVFHSESFRLKLAMSPHAAAEKEGVQMELNDFQLPQSANQIVVELAGGLMVPLNDNHLTVDLIKALDLSVVLVSQYYLGSINHTLLSINLLEQMGITIMGIVFNGRKNENSKYIILKRTGLKCLLEIQEEEKLNKETIRSYAKRINF